MSSGTIARTRYDRSSGPAAKLVEAYARAHGIGAWIWQRLDGDWYVVGGSGLPPHGAPGAASVQVPSAAESTLRVEVDAPDEEEAREAAGFLALVVGRELQHQLETRLMGREIAERYEEITLLYTISEILGSVISLERAAERILSEVVDTMGVKRAALWVHEPSVDSLLLIAAVGGEGHGETIPVDDDASITAAVFRDRRSMILDPTDVYPRRVDENFDWNRDSFLSVPVSYTPPRGDSRTIGVINLIGRRVEEGFTAGDQKLITAIASQIGAAVENSRLVAESLRQERVERELELAHDLQLKLLPSVEQFRDRAEVAARCAPADSVGGDFYQLFRLPGGCFGVVIGDVSSHGFGAALIMALTMSAIAIHASEGDPPAEVLRRAHLALVEELENTEMYLTLFYGVIDPNAGRLTYANAGHSLAYRISSSGEAGRLQVTNPPFGFVDLHDYSQTSVPWSAGEDLLFLFTDGLSDSIGGAEGEARLVDLVARERNRPLQDLLDALFAIEPVERGTPSDDRSAVLVRV